MAPQIRSRLRYAALAAAAVFVLVASGLVALGFKGFACGWIHASSYREAGGEGKVGHAYWIGSVPGRLMLASNRFESVYPNDLPAGTPRETSSRSGWFCGEETVAQGFADWADPTTSPTTLGFGWMNQTVELSSRSRRRYCVLIVPHWFALVIALIPSALLAVQRMQRRQP